MPLLARKEKGPARAGPFMSENGRQPLVTTGGGALPLPTSAHPATLKSARTAAVAIASFFITQPLSHDRIPLLGRRPDL